MAFKPLGKNILCDEDKAESKTESGIIIQGDSHQSRTATVIVVGPDVEFVKQGDTIVGEWHEAKRTVVGENEAIIISEDHVLAIIDK